MTAGETDAAVPLVTAPTLLLTLPVPPLNTPVNVVEVPAVMGEAADVKLVMAGAATTVSVKDCVAFGATPLFAVMVMGKLPVVPAPGVPAMEAVPLPLSVKLTPLGSDPVLLSAAVGLPVVVTLKVLFTPTVYVTLLALVIAGA